MRPAAREGALNTANERSNTHGALSHPVIIDNAKVVFRCVSDLLRFHMLDEPLRTDRNRLTALLQKEAMVALIPWQTLNQYRGIL